jgi:hydroxyacylglutathione hydrolase
MTIDIHTITTTGVNCYLLRKGDQFLLIDTSFAFRRRFIENEFDRLGCQPANLKLIVLTHGDIDHVGNAAYLGVKFKTLIGMHPDDWGMVEQGDMFWNRKADNSAFRNAIRKFIRLGKSNRFTPDIALQDGMNLHDYGFDLTIVGIPGHSSGSIGVLTREGDLFCGDFYMNGSSGPSFGFGDPVDFEPSAEKFKGMPIRTVYPGHGQPFQMEALTTGEA